MFSNLPVQSWKKYSGILGLKSWERSRVMAIHMKGGWRFYKSQLETLENQGKIAKGETMTHICFYCLLSSFSSGRPWHIKQREWRREICKSHMTTVRYHNHKSVALSHGGLLKAQSETDTLVRLSDKEFSDCFISLKHPAFTVHMCFPSVNNHPRYYRSNPLKGSSNTITHKTWENRGIKKHIHTLQEAIPEETWAKFR